MVVEIALHNAGLKEENRPRLLSDKGPRFKLVDFKEYLPTKGMYQVFVYYYNNCKYHKSLDNLTLLVVYQGSGERIMILKKEAMMRSCDLRREGNFKQNMKAI